MLTAGAGVRRRLLTDASDPHALTAIDVWKIVTVIVLAEPKSAPIVGSKKLGTAIAANRAAAIAMMVLMCCAHRKERACKGGKPVVGSVSKKDVHSVAAPAPLALA